MMFPVWFYQSKNMIRERFLKLGYLNISNTDACFKSTAGFSSGTKCVFNTSSLIVTLLTLAALCTNFLASVIRFFATNHLVDSGIMLDVNCRFEFYDRFMYSQPIANEY